MEYQYIIDKSIIRRIFNRFLGLLAEFAPGATTLRPFLHKLRGVKIYGKVFIGQEVILENEFPHRVELHDGVQIVMRSIILSHFRGTGKVIIEKNVWIGANCIISVPTDNRTLTIGEGSVIAALSVVTKDVPKGMFMGGSPAKPIARATVPMTLKTSYEDFQKGLIPLNKKKNTKVTSTKK